MSPKVSVIVLAWNGEKYLDACLSAVLSQDYEPREVIVVDNASSDGSVGIVQCYEPQVRLIQNDYNLGFAGGNNVGLKSANGEIVVLLNQDTVVQPGWLRALVDTLEDSSIGIVGCKILYPDGQNLQHAGARVRPDDAMTYHVGWGEQDHGQYDLLADFDYVTGAAIAIHRRVLTQLGGLDEQFYPGFYEETDYCFRARRAGFRVVYQPRAVFYHHETTYLPVDSYARSYAYHRNRVRFLLRHWDIAALESFAGADQRATAVTLSLDDVIARARAYGDNLVALPLIVAQRRTDPTLGGALPEGGLRWLIETLQSLRQQAHQRVVVLITDSAHLPAAADWDASMGGIQTGQTTARMQVLLQELASQTVLREPRLRSKLPVLGWLVDAFRRYWISLIERHYIVPILNQQSAFNAKVAELMRQLYEEIADLRQSNEATARLLSADDAAIPYVLQTILNDWKPRSTDLCKVSEE